MKHTQVKQCEEARVSSGSYSSELYQLSTAIGRGASAPYFQIDTTRPEEAEAILAISRGVGVFDDEETAVEGELLREYISKGAQASGYYFGTTAKVAHQPSETASAQSATRC